MAPKLSESDVENYAIGLFESLGYQYVYGPKIGPDAPSSERDSFEQVKLGDVAEIIGGGTPKTSVPEYWGGDIPWLSVVDFNTGKKFVNKTEKSITQKGLKNSSTKVLNIGDIIISARGTVGAMAILTRQMAFNQSCYGIRNIENKSNIEYLYYLLKDSINSLKQVAHGGVFDTITRTTFDSIDILLPPLKEQQAIAKVLSELDNKIELLHQQNQTLESLAETLFRQWFIEEAKEDWETKELSKFGHIVCGKTPSTKIKEYFNGDTPFIKIPDMHNNTFVFNTVVTLSEKGKLSQQNKTLPENSICVSCIATVGLVVLNAFESQTNQQINSIIPNEDFYRYYIYLYMKNSYELLQAMASGGTATLNLNTGDFSKMPILYPEKFILIEFSSKVTPFFDKIYSNQSQIRTLEALRDSLLPKLISGEIRLPLA